jgi:hypothetical protein
MLVITTSLLSLQWQAGAWPTIHSQLFNLMLASFSSVHFLAARWPLIWRAKSDSGLFYQSQFRLWFMSPHVIREQDRLMASKLTQLHRPVIYKGIKEIRIKLNKTGKINSIPGQMFPHKFFRIFIHVLLMFLFYRYRSTIYGHKNYTLQQSTIQRAQTVCSQSNIDTWSCHGSGG